MAKVVQSFDACDIGLQSCQGPLKEYRIAIGKERKTFLLCREHAKPIEDIWKRVGGTRFRPQTIVSMEDIARIVERDRRATH